jgi:hypothetical protein
LGWENCDGLGVRVTYFDFEDDASQFQRILAGTTVLERSIDIYAWDIELTQRLDLCGWDLEISSGVRIAGLESRFGGFDVNPEVDGALSLKSDFDSAGLTFAVGFDRQIGCSGLSAYGNFRGSLLYGSADVHGTLIAGGGFLGIPHPDFVDANIGEINNETISVIELKLGLQYDHCTSYGNLFVRAGVEGQLWEQPPVLLGLLDDNIGLFGPTVAVGFSR